MRHVLASPVDRVTALRGPALRQLRFLGFAAAVVGATAGHLADRRLDGNGVAWTACGALSALATVVLAYGVACCVAGLRVPPAVATAAGLLRGRLEHRRRHRRVAHLAHRGLGRVALWPLHWDPIGLVGGVAVAPARGRRRAAAGRRHLARAARAAVAARRPDPLRRHAAGPAHGHRAAPPAHPGAGPHQAVAAAAAAAPRLPVLSRDVRSLLRWPLARAVRLGVVVGRRRRSPAGPPSTARRRWSSSPAWRSSSGGLDAAEPLGQELDHPTRRDDVPVPAGWIYVRHLPAMVAVVSLGARPPRPPSSRCSSTP